MTSSRPRERGSYQGLFGGVFGIALLIGPALGGFLTDNVGWHWIFFVNLPIGAVALAIIWRLLPRIRHPERVARSTTWAARVFTGGVVPILLGLTNKQTGDWTDPGVGGLMLLGLALLGVFVWVESRAKEPILPAGPVPEPDLHRLGAGDGLVELRLLRRRSSSSRAGSRSCIGSSATESGYQILPLMAGLMIGSIGSGQIVSRTGRYKWLMAAPWSSLTVGILLMTQLRADTPVTTHVGLAGDHGPGHRPVAGRLHDHRPERRAVRASWARRPAR